jgi:diacylglycerol O-acyltransferase
VGALALVNALTHEDPQQCPRPIYRHPHTIVTGSIPRLTARLWSLVRHNTAETLRLARLAAGAPARFMREPVKSVNEVFTTLESVRGILADALMPAVRDPLTADAGGLSRRLEVISVPIDRLHGIAATLKVTINDLVLAVLSGVMGAYYRERGVAMLRLNCLVPMNLRRTVDQDKLGNEVGLFNIRLPLDQRDAQERLADIVQQTRAAKFDRHGALYPVLAGMLTVIPGFVLGWLARQSLGRVNVACTNVPGVKTRRYLGGARIDALYPFASVVEGTPMVVALLSYADSMDIGIDVDPEAMPDSQRLTELFEEGLDEMARMASGKTRAA